MKQKLHFFLSKIFFGLLLTILCFNYTYPQKLKKTHNQTTTVKGHQLYKKTKIYDNSQKSGSKIKPRSVGDRAKNRIDYEFNMLKNPHTNSIPKNIDELSVEFSKSVKSAPKTKKSASKKGYSYWRSRGPYNVGGRTRALAVDSYDENIIFAGGVSGGLWRTENGGKNWQKVTRRKQSPSITAIVQDSRPYKDHIWYYSSGERYGNSASAGGAFYTGAGIYKSTNYGYTWRLLKSTKDGDLTKISPFEITNSLAINPKNGDLYVATFNGIHRSKDGGKTFKEVLKAGFDNWTEIMITPKGKIYATVEFFGDPNKGFFVSEDGDTWTNITPKVSGFFNGRTVMAHDPKNENIVYFFAESLSRISPSPFLFKYDAAVDSLKNRWTNLSANLPNTIGGFVGNLDLQGRYNMFIKVKPDDSNFIVLGGTNLYRSTTGFTTPSGNESWIGGYSPKNDISVYPNHHPDQHNFIFSKSNPNKAISANDGGIQITEDITASLKPNEPVEWKSLNNGYLTTQPYAVAFDPEAKSDDLVAGFQDNGTWYSNSKKRKHKWTEDFGGDGSFNAIADEGKTRYVSSQGGNIYRLNFNEKGENISFARIRPAILKSPSFINPFVLDPNNDNIMYMPDGNRILRNNDLDEVPTGTYAYATKNWVALNQTIVPSQNTITALDVSKFPVANRLYYATNKGNIYRMDNANIDNQEVTNISEGKKMPAGYVNNITVDPSNSDRVIAVFSNYGIQSIFLTENAGETWENVSGNLEENEDGTGNGPSVRWAAFYGDNEGVYVGTSTGLYFTYTLDGNYTYWFRERLPSKITNSVVAQVKTRKDGFIAVATHGNGLFSAKFPLWFELPEPSLKVSYLLKDIIVPQNSEPTEVSIKNLFISDYFDDINIELTNSNPNLVKVTRSDDKLILTYAKDKIGTASIALIASNDYGEKVSEGFTVTVEEVPVYEQNEEAVGSVPSQFITDFNTVIQSADDFTVPTGNTWTLNRVLAKGGANNSPALESATVIIFKDSLGKPGKLVYNSKAVKPTSKPDDANLNITLPKEVQLSEGSYWISVYANLAFNPNSTQWFWLTQNKVTGKESSIIDPANLFGANAVDWTETSKVFGGAPTDQVFQLFGITSDLETNEQTNESNQLASLETTYATVAYPNPSNGIFNFNLSTLGKGKMSINIYNITGQRVYTKQNIESTSNLVEWNASNLPSGIYLVNIKGQQVNFKGKLIKQ